MDNQRVAEVFVPDTSSGATGTFGSGYFIDEALVLTAGHVVDRVVAASCSGELVGEVRPLSSQSWLKARVVWRGTSCDAALLEICPVDRPRDGLNREWLGRLATYERAPFRAIGFPEAQARNEAGGRLIRDTEEIRGNFVPLTGLKTALLTLDLEGSVPNAMVAARSPWAGMSGAAVFSGSHLVGIVAEDPQNFEPDRLRVTPVTSMVEEAGFRTFIAGDADRPVLLDAVEDVALTQFVLRAPYRPLPPNAAPSFLLRSIFGVVPFRGRAAEMRSLSDWCASDASIALALIVAPGGSGKTRLAAELCRKQRDDGWVSGFLDADANRDQLRGLARVTSRLLVAVDYAETRVAQVIDLIERLARSTPSTNRIRVLLIARETGDWWPSLPSRVEGVDAELLVRAATLYELGPIEREPIARRDAFREAARHFAPIMGVSYAGLVEPDLSAPLFDTPLFIQMAALTALEARSRDPASRLLVAEDLLGDALTRETRYWRETSRVAGLDSLDDRLRRRAVTLATLGSAFDEGDAAGLLRAIPDLDDGAQEGARRQLANWLHHLYPGQGWFRPLEPDLLGEALVAAVLDEIPELVDRLFALDRPDRAKRPLAVLTRAARHHHSAETSLAAAIAQRLRELWMAAMAVAEETGDPIGSILAKVLEHDPQPDVVNMVLERLPGRTVALRELAVVATRVALDRVLGDPPGPDRASSSGRLYNDLSNHLSELGRHEEALAAIEEAVELRRGLAAARPDTFRPDLAGSLKNLSHRLDKLGRQEESLAAIEEATGIFKELAAARPDEFRADLAIALNHLSNQLSQLGRHEEALIPIEDATRIFRELAAADPGAFQPNLAMALDSLSLRLSQLGRHEDAIATIDEGITLRRALAAAQPEAFRPDLASSLTILSSRRSELGRHEDALAAIQEAVAIYRELVAARPDAFRPDLALALKDLSNRLAELGGGEPELAAIEEATGILRELAAAWPDVFQHDLATALNDLANHLSRLGRDEEALTAIEDAVTLRRTLAAERPEAFRHDLAVALSNLSNHLSKLNRHEEALAAIEEAVTLRQALAAERPEAFRYDLAGALASLSNRLSELDRHTEALAAIKQAVTLRRALAAERPEAFQYDLAGALNSLAQRLSELGRHKQAIRAIQESVALRRALAAERPEAFRHDLATALNSLSNHLSEGGKNDDALSAIVEAAGIYRELAAARPDNERPFLAGALTSLSKRLLDLGRPEDALASSEETVTIYRELAETRPDVFRLDLARALHAVSDQLTDLGRPVEALTAKEEAVEILP